MRENALKNVCENAVSICFIGIGALIFLNNSIMAIDLATERVSILEIVSDFVRRAFFILKNSGKCNCIYLSSVHKEK